MLKKHDLNIDIADILFKRIGWSRDLLIYLLWELGRFPNMEIGMKVGISSSNARRQVKEIKEKFEKDKLLRSEYENISALIRV